MTEQQEQVSMDALVDQFLQENGLLDDEDENQTPEEAPAEPIEAESAGDDSEPAPEENTPETGSTDGSGQDSEQTAPESNPIRQMRAEVNRSHQALTQANRELERTRQQQQALLQALGYKDMESLQAEVDRRRAEAMAEQTGADTNAILQLQQQQNAVQQQRAQVAQQQQLIQAQVLRLEAQKFQNEVEALAGRYKTTPEQIYTNLEQLGFSGNNIAELLFSNQRGVILRGAVADLIEKQATTTKANAERPSMDSEKVANSPVVDATESSTALNKLVDQAVKMFKEEQ